MDNKSKETLNFVESEQEKSSINKIHVRYKSDKYPRTKKANEYISTLLGYTESFKSNINNISKDKLRDFFWNYKALVDEAFECDFYDGEIPVTFVRVFDKLTQDILDLTNQTECLYLVRLLGWMSITNDYLHKNTAKK